MKKYLSILSLSLLLIAGCCDDEPDCCSTNEQVNLEDGLQAFFPLNGHLNDTLQGIAGMLQTASWGPGPGNGFDQALTFNGIDGYALLPHHPAYNFGVHDDFTISLFVQFSDQPNLEITTNSIASKWCEPGDCGGSASWFLRVRNGSSDNDGAFLYGRRDRRDAATGCSNTFWETTEQGGYGDGQWHHVVYTKRANELLLYVDDELQHKGFDNTSTHCGVKNQSPVYLGVKEEGHTNLWFRGAISQLRFYNRSLNREEISQLNGQ